MWELQPPGKIRACPGLNGFALLLPFPNFKYKKYTNIGM
jgi:hypothetical protein